MSAAAPWSPNVAVVTNFAPNHLDWHTTLDHYRASKQQILAHQRVADARVLPRSLIDWHTDCEVDGLRLYPVDDALTNRVPPLSIPGAHNRCNAAMALAVVEALGFDADQAARAIATFGGLPHRLEFAGQYKLPQGGMVRAFNDSKCTTPQACVLALDAFSHAQGEVGIDRVRLIIGGYDKKTDLTPMVRAAVPCVGVYAIGATGQGLTRSLKDAGATASYFDTLDSAVRAMVADATDGEILLLSPGCASWGQFRNYEQRGKAFVDAVKTLPTPSEGCSGASHAYST